MKLAIGERASRTSSAPSSSSSPRLAFGDDSVCKVRSFVSLLGNGGQAGAILRFRRVALRLREHAALGHAVLHAPGVPRARRRTVGAERTEPRADQDEVLVLRARP